ncbi:MAG: uroporphyrinogen-III synthase [Steroidobacteraceae bacterium]
MTRTVVVTRDEPAGGPLSQRLEGLGLEVLSWPVVSIGPPADPGPLEAALASAAHFDWIVFASRHGADAVTARLASPPRGVRIAAVGERTAAALGERGWPPEVVPEHATAAALVERLAPLLRPGARVLFPASSRALPTLAAGLRARGAQVEQVEAYCTGAAALDVSACRARIDRDDVGAVTFTSPSCVEELGRALGRGHFEHLLASAVPIALGSTTARAVAQRGFESVLAEPATLDGLAATTYRQLSLRS